MSTEGFSAWNRSSVATRSSRFSGDALEAVFLFVGVVGDLLDGLGDLLGGVTDGLGTREHDVPGLGDFVGEALELARRLFRVLRSSS